MTLTDRPCERCVNDSGCPCCPADMTPAEWIAALEEDIVRLRELAATIGGYRSKDS